MSSNSELGLFTTNVIRFLINLLTRNILAGVIVYSCWLSIIHYHYWFTWHIILCTIGYLPLMAESLMLFAGDELWSKQLTRKQKFAIHGFLITFGTVLITAGTVNIIYYTTEQHFTTTHGITGLISMTVLLISIILGYMTNYSQTFKVYIKPIWLKLSHNLFGQFGYLMGIISLCFAYYTRWFVYYTSEESRIVALIATIIGTLWTINTAVVSAYYQLKTAVK